MRKFKQFASKIVAFTLASAMVATGMLDNVSFRNVSVTGNVSNTIEAEAATQTGTVNADTFSWDNASVYFLLTDRFKNGNTANDHSYNRGLDQNGQVITGVDDRATFHGGDFAGITETIEDGYFNDLGINALWISAPYEQIHGYIVGGDGSPSFAHYSYHGYYVLDYTNSDANFGTMEEFQTLVDTAHEHGIRVIMDVVLNHAGYNSLYDMNEYDFGCVKDGWEDYYYSMQNVNNADYHSYIDYEGSAAQWGKWWGDWVRAGLPGYTEGGSTPTTQSLSGLPDFKTESTSTVGIPTFLATKWKQEGRYDEEVAELKSYLSSHGYEMTVTNCISYWLSSWVREYGVDGFRCDTAKHVECTSWARLNEMCTEALKTWKTNNPTKKLDDLDFWMTGEHWDHGVGYDEYYSVGNFDSMLNFSTLGGGMLAEGKIDDIYSGYAAAINTKDDFNALSFMSSHDSQLAGSDRIYLGSAFLLLPGGVQTYYGDETNRGLVDGIPFDGNGGAGHSLRSDMNWDSIDEAVLAHWQKVGTFRNNHIAVGAGTNAKIDSTAGHAFTRTYEKGNIKDRVAFCIAAGANTNVTMDVSSIWEDGSNVVNYYDSSSAVVTNGEVTFNSGANGTILVQDPDGKPLVTISGAAKFKGTQTVTVTLQETEQAIISVDGGKKFVVKNGDTFTIGDKAYEGDTISVSYTATNDKGTVNGKASFYKAYQDEDISDKPVVVENGVVHVKTTDGSAPYIYAWSGSSTALTGAWPGTQMTEKDDEGYYVYDLNTEDKYNVIFNGGSGKGQTSDITGLSGKTYFNLASDYTYTQEGVVDKPISNTVTIHVKPYGSTAPYFYVWDTKGSYNGGFPGKQLSNPDADGWYTFTKEGVTSLSCIVGKGTSSERTGDITGITGEAWITITSEDSTKYTIEKTQAVESKMSLLRKEARQVRNMIQYDYTDASWANVMYYMPKAEVLIGQGDLADLTEVEEQYNNLVAAKAALVLKAPKITSASTATKVIKGTAAYGSAVTVKIGSKTYETTADEITDVWSVTATSLTNTDVVYVTASRNGNSSEKLTYNMNGNNPSEELTASANASASNVKTGSAVTFSGTASGGSGSYTYKFVIHNTDTNAWFLLKDFSSSSSVVWTAGSAGNREIFMDVKDGSGKVVRSEAVNVKVGAGTELAVNGTATSSANKVGDKVTFSASATGGSGSYTYKFVIHNKTNGSWYLLKDFSTVKSVEWTAGSAGAREIFVDVKDGSGKVVRSSAINVVTSDANGLTVNGSVTASSVTKGTQVKFIGLASGGTGNYTYSYVMHNITTDSWYRFSGFSASNTLVWNAGSTGVREMFVEVKDGSGKVVRSSAINITVK